MKYIVIFLLFLLPVSGYSYDCNNSAVDSLFYQPVLETDKDIDWDYSFQRMSEVKIHRLILQWSRHGDVDFLKDRVWLENILITAEKYNINVIIGLYADHLYFQTLENKKLDLKNYLNRLLIKNSKQADAVFQIAAEYSSFEGWYIYDEINDLNFRSYDRQTLLKNYLEKLSEEVKFVSPKPIYISNFFSGNMDPEDYVKMMNVIISGHYKLLIQTGIGANLVTETESSIYLKEFFKNYDGDYTIIVESFNKAGNKILPAQFKGLKRQIEIALPLSYKKTVSAFSMKYFFDENFFKRYKAFYCSEM